MAVNKVDYRSTKIEDVTRSPSPQIWGDCRVDDIDEDAAVGIFIRDDFRITALLATPTLTTEAYYNNGWKAFGSAGGTLLGASLLGGMGIVATETDDNQGVNLATLALPFKISRASGKFWWEARLKIGSIVTLDTGWVAGLMDQQTLTAIVPITAAGALADVNFFGFQKPEASTTTFNSTYKANGVAQVVVKSGVLADCPTTTAVAADTFIKVGMKYEPVPGPYGAYQLSYFVNGFRLPDRYTMAAADGTDFPNDVNMGLVFANLCGSNNDSVLTVDWVQVAQEF